MYISIDDGMQTRNTLTHRERVEIKYESTVEYRVNVIGLTTTHAAQWIYHNGHAIASQKRWKSHIYTANGNDICCWILINLHSISATKHPWHLAPSTCVSIVHTQSKIWLSSAHLMKSIQREKIYKNCIDFAVNRISWGFNCLVDPRVDRTFSNIFVCNVPQWKSFIQAFWIGKNVFFFLVRVKNLKFHLKSQLWDCLF